MNRAALRHRRFSALLGLESLETRTVMSADISSAAQASVRQIEWNNRLVEANADAWIVRTAASSASVDSLGLAAGWKASSLGEGFFSLTAPGASANDVVGWASRTSGVSYVEPDFVIAPTAVPNDPSFPTLWGLDNVGQSGGVRNADINAPEAWNTTTGSRNVVVAVIDTGVDYTHPDLAANIWRNPGEIPGDGIDNDRDGYVDDVYGWNFSSNNANPMDDNGHGSHVAGTIGAVGNNGVGVTGVNWQVSIMPVKFLSASGSGLTSGAIAAINYVTHMKRDMGINIVATNNSWGGGGFSTSLRDAIEAGGRAGILFVAAAGNDGRNTDVNPSYPAAYTSDAIISVAAVDRSNRLAGFSNYGTTSVDVGAPGVGILSTTPRNTYSSYSGTSMATPHVTGVVALLAAANPQASASRIRNAILSTTTPTASLAGKVATGGMLNAFAAVQAIRSGATLAPAPTPPAIPAPVTPPAPTPAPVPVTIAGEAGDTLATAMAVNGTIRLDGCTIGDGTNGNRDIDLYKVALQAGQSLTVDIDARSLARRSTLDSVVRLFDATGRELARNDDYEGSADSYLNFSAPTAGTYYVGVSGYGNASYNLVTGTAPKCGSTGAYEVLFSFAPAAAQNATVIRTLGIPDADSVAVPAPAVQPQAVAPQPTQVLAAHRDAAFVAAAATDWFTSGSSTNGRSGSRRIAF